MESIESSSAQWFRVVRIIAMQGDPYTGKTTLAKSLAKTLKYDLIPFDGILDTISPDNNQYLPSEEEGETLMSIAFNVVIERATSILTGTGDSVIVDSPLSRRSQLDKLVALRTDVEAVLTKSLRNTVVQLVIIECKPKDSFIWEKRFNERDSSSYDTKWYKPHEWPFDPKFSAQEAADAEVLSAVSKLVIDTSDHVQIDHVRDTVQIRMTTGNRVELTRKRDKSHGPPFYKLPREKRISKSGNSYYCSAHTFWYYMEEGLIRDDDDDNHVIICNACAKNVSGGVYTCWNCSFALHKSCAELIGEEERTTTFSPQEFPEFLKIEAGTAPSFRFPQHQACYTCKQDGKSGCDTCLFDSHLKSQLVPTILHHQGHKENPLFFWLSKKKEATGYVCKACRCPGEYVGYSCVDDCGVNYHPQCALLPLVFKHTHDGYTHDLEMVFHREKESDDAICALRLKRMNPKAWYYWCKICKPEFHLECAFKDFH